MSLLIRGMHGLGDCLRSRAIIRQLMKVHGNDIWLETPWPCLYHDMDIRLVNKSSRLRTQAKNAQREQERYSKEPLPFRPKTMRIDYPPDMVRRHGSVLAAMSAQCGVEIDDFSLPIPDEWHKRAVALIDEWKPTKPIMIYRPLIERTEWGGCRNRNPDKKAYRVLLESIRDKFFIVSVADLVDGVEWMVSEDISPDVEYHAGELDIELLAALTELSAMVYTSPGFAAVLAQSVGTPSVVVFGGYENSKSFYAEGNTAPYLGIDPINPCECFSHHHRCRKEIDIPMATERLKRFVDEIVCA